MVDAASWYLALLVVGAAGLLPAALLCGRLASAGAGYARPLALALLALAAWLLTRFTPVPYGTPSIVLLLVALGAWSGWLAVRRPPLRRRVREAWPALLATEAVFLALFVAFVTMRAQAPDATGTEKPMDMMLLNAVHHADSMPPPDAWFAGERVAYYHLGHSAVDVAGRLGGTPPALSFTLGVPLAGAMAGAAAFALGGDVLALARRVALRERLLAGGAAATLLVLLAPVEGAAELAAANGLAPRDWWAALGVEGLPSGEGAAAGVPREFWWWWHASRALPGLIAEFPAFSIVLGDLHAHLLALPLALVALAFAAAVFEGGAPLTPRRWLADPQRLLLAGALFAALAMTNLWDAPLYGAVALVAGAAAFASVGWPWPSALLGAARSLALPGLAAFVLLLPFLATLDAPESGLAAVTEGASDPARFALTWLPLALPVPLLALALRPALDRRATLVAGGVAALAVGSWAVAATTSAEGSPLLERGAGWLTLLLLGIALAAGAGGAASAIRRGDRPLGAVLGLATLAAAVVFATELVYVVDAFDTRMNTVFKTWYGAWALLAVAGGAAVALAVERVPSPRWRSWPVAVPLAATLVLTLGSLLYLPAAAISRGREGQQAGLDALAYLERSEPGLAAAVQWARTLPDGSVLLEAPGPSYADAALVSSFSGTPALIGWPGHELQWRDALDEITRRVAVAERVFEGGDADLARAEGVTHVVVGDAERRRFGGDLDARFATWEVAFRRGDTTVYAVPSAPAERRTP